MPVKITKARRIKNGSKLKPFDCGHSDLNDFFFHDSQNHLNELLAVTYVFEKSNKTIAFISVLNDKITQEDTNKMNRIKRPIPNEKRKYRSYPAVKIGRFGVDKQFQGNGIGTKILNAIKGSFSIENKTGCRYITVDALNNKKTINFYISNGFDFLTDEDATKKQRLMFFDLKRFSL